MSPTAVKLIAGYAAGVVTFPFVFSCIDGWPLARPKPDREDLFFTVALLVFWPVIAVVWLVYAWWCVSSWLGAQTREAVAGLFRRGRAK